MKKAKKKPKVTVLVTVKNAAGTIEACVESIMNQSFKDFVLYVTDAYSTDGTWEKLKKLKKKYGSKMILERVHGNIAKAHNYMISKVDSEFIAFTDADCVVDKHWLKNLLKGFTSKEILATAGYCGTPKDVNFLQRLVGKEIEYRFKHAPKFLPRAPTMNLCVRSEWAKKIKFDEAFDVAQETDWGYRLTKHGKMRYVPDAIVWHYHRQNLRSFFKQQRKYAKYSVFLLLKHGKLPADYNSRPTLFVHQLLFLAFLLSLPMSFLLALPQISLVSLLLLLLSYLYEATRLSRNPVEILAYIPLFFLRNLAYTTGLFDAFLEIFKRKLPKIKKVDDHEKT